MRLVSGLSTVDKPPICVVCATGSHIIGMSGTYNGVVSPRGIADEEALPVKALVQVCALSRDRSRAVMPL